MPPGLISQALAGFAAGFRVDHVPPEIISRAKHLILDALGIALASTRYEFSKKAMAGVAGLSGAGDSVVIGMPGRLPMRDAALMNGILIHGLDFDDTHSGGVVHATSSVLPTVLAVGAQLRFSGSEMLGAYVIGIEAAARLGAVARGGFHQVGFHPTGLIGAFACALAAGRLMGLDEQQLVMAQGLALSVASGTLEFLDDGAWNKRLHPGWAAHGGITAAALARGGFIGTLQAYEGRFGLYASHLQDRLKGADLSLATAGLGAIWEVLQVALKPFPSCHFMHACTEAAIALARDHKLSAGEIERVRALVPAEIVSTVCEPIQKKRRPANSYEAQFSIPYAIATALRRARFTLDELEDDALLDAQTHAIADRVHHEIDPQSTFPRHYSGEVIVETSDGRLLRRRVQINLGNGERPLAEHQIVEKFRSNASRALSEDQARKLEALILSIDERLDVSDFAEKLTLESG